jgi:hypothetical protein
MHPETSTIKVKIPTKENSQMPKVTKGNCLTQKI